MHKHILDELAEVERETAEMQRYMDRLSGLVFMMRTTADMNHLRKLYGLYQEESAKMNALSDLLNNKFENILKEGNVKRSERFSLGLVIIFLMVALFISVVGAQDAPLETNTAAADVTAIVATAVPGEVVTAEVTLVPEQPPVIIVDKNPPPVDSGVNNYYVVGFVLLVLGSVLRDWLRHRETATLVNGVNSLAQNQQTMTLAQQTYNQSSVGVQQVIEMFRAFVGVVSAANIPGLDPLADAGKATLDKIVGAPGTDTSAGSDPRADMLRRMEFHDAEERKLGNAPGIPEPEAWKPQEGNQG